MSNFEKGIADTRKRIEKAIEIAEAERHRQLLNHRIEIAQAGLLAFKRKDLTLAIKSFQAYLKILEEVKSVSAGGLGPEHFNKQEDKNELLMISGVYWDLAKIYDRARSPEKKNDFKFYLSKYILFSKGMPFQHVCSETLRKFISTGRAVHKSEFKEAYKVLGGSRCYVATALRDVISPETMPTLQLLRDQVLRKNKTGRAFIYHYYNWGPWFAARTFYFPQFLRRGMGKGLDWLANRVRKRIPA